MRAVAAIDIQVLTGDQRNEAKSKAKVILYDDKGNSSDPITLQNCFRDDFQRGHRDCVRPSKEVMSLDAFGTIVKIHLFNDSSLEDSPSDWYIDKIVVENKNGKSSSEFPVFSLITLGFSLWVKADDTSLPQFDDNPDQRQKKLEEKRNEYQYDQKVPNGPVEVKTMPSEENFSFLYKINLGLQFAIYKSDIKKIMPQSGEWSSLSEIINIYDEAFKKPKGADNWESDVHFGLQRVASLNHSVIQLSSKIPEKMPVTEDQLKPFLEGLTIQESLDKKRLFHCDFEILEGLPVKDNLTLCAPIGLFFVNNSKQLTPVAIQLFQQPGPDNPVFTPSCPPLTWTLVKMWFNLADAAYHQAITHLGMTHMLMEGVTVATHRNLSQSHPIFKLLAPHFLYIIAINNFALTSLVSEGGLVDRTMTYGRNGLLTLLTKRFETWRMDIEGTLPADLKGRGVDDLSVLPCYHFRDDALLLYDAIKKYVTSYVHLYYASTEFITGDNEIQSWAKELVMERNKSEGGVGIKGVPGNGQITSSDQLILIATSIIYTCSVGHAAANFPQYDEYGFPPNYPAFLSGKPPSSTDTRVTEKDILDSLANCELTGESMVLTKILSQMGTWRLGNFEVNYISDPKAMDIVDAFQRELQLISVQIEDRNRTRDPPYDYLDPKKIPNSISI